MSGQLYEVLQCSLVENVAGRESNAMLYESMNSSACDGATKVHPNLYISYILPTESCQDYEKYHTVNHNGSVTMIDQANL